MRIVYADSELIADFIVATREEALALIADGAINGVELLEEAGLTTAEAEAELAKLDHDDLPQEVIDRMAYDDQPGDVNIDDFPKP